MDDRLLTIFKNICSATFVTDIAAAEAFYQSLILFGFNDVSKGEHSVTMIMSQGKFLMSLFK